MLIKLFVVGLCLIPMSSQDQSLILKDLEPPPKFPYRVESYFTAVILFVRSEDISKCVSFELADKDSSIILAKYPVPILKMGFLHIMVVEAVVESEMVRRRRN